MINERLYYCNSTISKEYRNTTYPATIYTLTSYKTPVAKIFEYKDGTIYIVIFRFNSNTTAKHLRKFQEKIYKLLPLQIADNYKHLLDTMVEKKNRLAYLFDDVQHYKIKMFNEYYNPKIRADLFEYDIITPLIYGDKL